MLTFTIPTPGDTPHYQIMDLKGLNDSNLLSKWGGYLSSAMTIATGGRFSMWIQHRCVRAHYVYIFKEVKNSMGLCHLGPQFAACPVGWGGGTERIPLALWGPKVKISCYQLTHGVSWRERSVTTISQGSLEGNFCGLGLGVYRSRRAGEESENRPQTYFVWSMQTRWNPYRKFLLQEYNEESSGRLEET